MRKHQRIYSPSSENLARNPEGVSANTSGDRQNDGCPNCGQWQYRTAAGYYDCFNDCAAKKLAPKVRHSLDEPISISERLNRSKVESAHNAKHSIPLTPFVRKACNEYEATAAERDKWLEKFRTVSQEKGRIRIERDKLREQLADAVPADVYLIIKKQRDADEAKLREQVRELRQQIQVLLDSVDWSSGNCRVNEQIGAVLPKLVIDNARAAIKHAEEGK